jgi:parallel beta-helix repeat protein
MRLRQSLFPLAPTMALAVAALVLPTSSQALQTFCVANVTQLNNAVLALENDDVEIRIVAGTYNLSGSCLEQDYALCDGHDNALTIKGGYAPGCATRSLDPAVTVLTAPGRTIWLKPVDVGLDTSGALQVSRLTIRNVARLDVFLRDLVSLDAVWLDQNGTNDITADPIVMRNSLVTRSGANEDELALDLCCNTIQMDNNTITANEDFAELLARDTSYVRNNIFWGNGPLDLRFRRWESDDPPLEVSVRNNLWGSVQGLGNLANPPSSTLTSNPQFVNAAALDFRLQASSPAISTAFPASSLFVQQDFTGGPRWFGEAPDRGAFESTIGTTAPLIIVQNTNDSGTGSLRQAILDANALPNVNRIEFDIGTTCGPRNIVLSTPLPTITQPLVIDGYTQPGAVRNSQTIGSNGTICIAITGAGSVINGISTASDDGVSVSIDGIGFGGFTLNAVNLTGGNGHRFVGSQVGGQIGPAATPLTLAPSLNGLVVGSLIGSAGADGVEIGGVSPAERNVFSDATDAAILLGSGAEDARIVNNYIGVGPSGALATESNRRGVVILGRNNEVRGNVISNNTLHGVFLTGSNARANRIIDNRIGIGALCVLNCSSTLGNTEDGIRLEAGASDNRIEGNIISHNGDDGVVITGAQRNAVLRNVITDNTEQPIDLGDDGASANGNNSVPAPPAAGNLGQNRPQLTGAAGPPGFGIATGTLSSANGFYRIDFYSAINCLLPIIANNYGEPETWLGTTYATITNGTATTDGSVAFSGLIGVAGSLNFFGPTRRIVATATRMAGSTANSVPRGSSEASSCVAYTLELFKDGFEN